MDRLPALDEVIVWYEWVVPDDLARIQKYEGLLSPRECAKIEGLRFEARVEYVTAHALLRRALSLYAEIAPEEWNFALQSEGRPYLLNAPMGSGLDFNLSHTEGLVACAITRLGPVGVDVECLKSDRDGKRFASRVLADEELRWLEALAPEDRDLGLLDLWTLKEAHFKALGTGIVWPLSALQFELDSFEGARKVNGPSGHVEDGEWHYTRRLLSPNHRLSAAIPCGNVPRWKVAEFLK